jgi:hypothetical protein
LLIMDLQGIDLPDPGEFVLNEFDNIRTKKANSSCCNRPG